MFDMFAQFLQPTPHLSEALALAKKDFKPIIKGTTVDFPTKRGKINFNYATLADIHIATTEALSNNGLALISQIVPTDSKTYLITRLTHSSGEFVASFYPLPDPATGDIDPKAFGAARSYASRYNIISLLECQTTEDDQGNGDRRKAVQFYREGDRSDTPQQVTVSDRDLYPKHNGIIKQLRIKLGLTDPQYVLNLTNGRKPSELTVEEYHGLLKTIAIDWVSDRGYFSRVDAESAFSNSVNTRISSGVPAHHAVELWLAQFLDTNADTIQQS
jgi:hypothetical protein